ALLAHRVQDAEPLLGRGGLQHLHAGRADRGDPFLQLRAAGDVVVHDDHRLAAHDVSRQSGRLPGVASPAAADARGVPVVPPKQRFAGRDGTRWGATPNSCLRGAMNPARDSARPGPARVRRRVDAPENAGLYSPRMYRLYGALLVLAWTAVLPY